MCHGGSKWVIVEHSGRFWVVVQRKEKWKKINEVRYLTKCGHNTNGNTWERETVKRKRNKSDTLVERYHDK